jgi:hypothetical protein
MNIYTTPSQTDIQTASRYGTNGLSGATVVNQSGLATGIQEVANNFLWRNHLHMPLLLAEAYTPNGKSAYQYTFTVSPSIHGLDLFYYFPVPLLPLGYNVQVAFQKAYGKFVANNRPSDWPLRSATNPIMVHLNSTGGFEINLVGFTFLLDPGVKAVQTNVDVYTWEGGRKARCDFLRSIGSSLTV